MLAVVCAGCPTNFTYISSVNGCYKLVTDRYTNWAPAGRMCQTLHTDAHLLIINDAQEQRALTSCQFPFLSFFIVSLYTSYFIHSSCHVTQGRNAGS